MSTSELKYAGKTAMRAQFAVALLTLLLEGVLVAAGSVIPVVGSLLLMGPLELGAIEVFYYISRGEKADVGMLFNGFRHRFAESFLCGLLETIFVALWSLLLVIPGIVKAYSYAMAYYIMMQEPEIGGYEAIQRSREMMDGNKWNLFVLDLSFIGWILLCIITLGLANLYVMPYMTAARMEFFNSVYMANTRGIEAY